MTIFIILLLLSLVVMAITIFYYLDLLKFERAKFANADHRGDTLKSDRDTYKRHADSIIEKYNDLFTEKTRLECELYKAECVNIARLKQVDFLRQCVESFVYEESERNYLFALNFGVPGDSKVVSIL